MHIYIYRDWFTFCLFSIYPNPLAQAICSWLPPIVVSILPRTMLFEYWKKQVCVFLCMRCSQQNITNKNSGLLSSDPPCISFVVARHNHVLLGKNEVRAIWHVMITIGCISWLFYGSYLCTLPFNQPVREDIYGIYGHITGCFCVSLRLIHLDNTYRLYMFQATAA